MKKHAVPRFRPAPVIGSAVLVVLTAGVVAATDYREGFAEGAGGWSGGRVVAEGGASGSYLESSRSGANGAFEPTGLEATPAFLGDLAATHGDSFMIRYSIKALTGDLGWSHEIRRTADADDTRWSFQVCRSRELPHEWTHVQAPFDARWSDDEATAAGWVRKRGRSHFGDVVRDCGGHFLGFGASGPEGVTVRLGLDEIAVISGPLPPLPITNRCGYNADLNNDGVVDAVDEDLLVACMDDQGRPYDPWHPPRGCPFIPRTGERDRTDFGPGAAAVLPPDLDADGKIDERDLQLLRDRRSDTIVASRLPAPPEIARDDYLGMVRLAMDSLIEWGRDRYGPEHTPLFAAIVMQDTLECPADPFEYPTTRPRAVPGRSFWRSPGSANQYFDQAMFVAMDVMSDVTADPKYRTAALDALRFNLKTAIDKRGMPALGGHYRWNLRQDVAAANGAYHEVWHLPMAWHLWYEADPDLARSYFDKIWEWHVVDKETGETNRHADGQPGWSFTLCDGTLLGSWAYLFTQQSDPALIERCRTVANYHWARRNPDTGLFPASGGTYGIRRNRHDTTQFETTTMAFAHFVLEAALQTGDAELMAIGRGVLDGYAKHGWDDERKCFYARISLDGTPYLPEAERGCVTGHLDPEGYLPVWMPTLGFWERPLVTAQTYAWAAEEIDRDAYLPTAMRWADLVERAWRDRYGGFADWYGLRDALRPFDLEFPVQGTRRSVHAPTERADAAAVRRYRTGGYVTQAAYGLFAEHYGRVIQLFLAVHRLTGDERWLGLAQEVADEAVRDLWRGRIFVGHVEKVSSENLDQVGILMLALVELSGALGKHNCRPLAFF